MSAVELLRWTSQGVLLLLALLTLVDLARHRDRQRLDIALMFANLAVIILFQRLQVLTHAPWMETAGSVMFLAHPILLLRLVQHFRPLDRRLMPAALLGLLGSCAVTLIWRPLPVPFLPHPPPLPLTLAVLAYFVGFELAAIGATLNGARRSAGVTRRRLQLASVGEGLLASILVLAGVTAVWPATLPWLTPLFMAISLVLSIAYYLAFAPPRWLRQSWQLTELLAFLRELSRGSPEEAEEAAIAELRTRATLAVGGLGAVTAIWDEQKGTLSLRSPPEGAPAGALALEGAIGRAWRERRPIVSPDDLGAGNAWLAERFSAGAFMVVPIMAAGRASGLLVVLLRQMPIFEEDDTALLSLLAEQTATTLGYASLVRAQRALVSQLREHGRELEGFTQELEGISYSLSHDLRTPLRGIDGFAQAVLEDYGGRLDETGREHLRRVRTASQRMGRLLDDFVSYLALSRIEREVQRVDLSVLAADIANELERQQPGRRVTFEIQPGVEAEGDPRLVRSALQNLLSNAWKFTSKHATAQITFGATREGGETVYFVRDNGAGFDPAYAHKLFQPFQRLHPTGEYDGSGLGLAIVQRVVQRHGGRAWAEGGVEQGATFYFTLAPRARAPAARQGAVA